MATEILTHRQLLLLKEFGTIFFKEEAKKLRSDILQ